MALPINLELLEELTKREIKQRYKQSMLGYAWVILNPLAQMLVLSFVFSRFLPVHNLSIPYPIFLYVGLLPWTLFTTTLTASTNAFISNSKLITKIYLPRTVFIQSTILAKMIDFLLASSVFMLFLIYFQVSLSWSSLWFIPLFLIQTLFTYGLSLLIATLNLFYRDIQYLLNFMLMVWMYITPIIYPTTFFPAEYQWIFQINPMVVLINSYRQVLFENSSPHWESVGISFIISLLVYFLGISVFKKLEGRFADVI